MERAPRITLPPPDGLAYPDTPAPGDARRKAWDAIGVTLLCVLSAMVAVYAAHLASTLGKCILYGQQGPWCV